MHFKPREFENDGLEFRKHFSENGAFRRCRQDHRVTSLAEFS